MSARRDVEVGEVAADISRQIYAILAGNHPAIQGAIIADVMAMWLAGHPTEVRDALLALNLEAMRKLIPVNEAIIRSRRR